MRVGVAIPAGPHVRWREALIKSLAPADCWILQIATKPTKSALRRYRDVAFQGFVAIDKRAYKHELDGFDTEKLSIPREKHVRLELEVDRVKVRPLEGSILAQVRELQLDYIVWLLNAPPPFELAALTHFGLISYQFGGVFDAVTAGCWETLRSFSPLRTTVFLHRPGQERPIRAYESYSPIDRDSVVRTRTHVLMKSAEFADRVISFPPVNSNGDGSVFSLAEESPPGPLVLARHIFRVIRTRAAPRRRDQWLLAYTRSANSVLSDLNSIHLLIPPNDRFWADPFPERFEGRDFIFAEQLIYKENKGQIIVFELRADGTTSEPEIALEQPYHLSYPFVFQWDSRFFMIPETFDAATVELYECVEWPHAWKLVQVLLRNVRAVDTTLVNHNGRWYLFTTIGQPGTQCTDELYLFSASTPLGPWTACPRNPVLSDVRAGRCAGRLDRVGGKLYRPAQDCSRRYGGAISMREVRILDEQNYQEEEVLRIEPTWAQGLVATHTINRLGDLTVLDGCRLLQV